MTSIGNDIIALALVNPERTRKEKFFSKIICRQEVELFKSIDPSVLSFEHFVWLAWSIKESVYKFYKRSEPETLFSPTKIIIQKIHIPANIFSLNTIEHEEVSFADEFCFCCEISFNDHVFFTRSLLQDDLIFTVANNINDFENICWGIKKIDSDLYYYQSENVRAFAGNRLKCIMRADDLVFEKTEGGYPFIKQKKNIPVSFTHHGYFVGYAFALSQKIKIPHQ